MSRQFFVLLHRWVGLAMAGFLVVVGLTGSLLAFLPELQHTLNPEFYAADTGQPRLDLASLAERAEALAPRAQVNGLWAGEPDSAQVNVSPRTVPETGQPYALDYDQLILDPYTGRELGRRTWGAIAEGLHNLMPFIYKLHYSLVLDAAGVWVLGVTALAWTLDSFVGFYLTLPPPRGEEAYPGGEPRRSFRQRWSQAWRVKWRASAYRVNFDLHRAGGLWLWAALLVFAWSSVSMNLGDTVYVPVTRWVFEYHEPWLDLPVREQPLAQPRLGWREAQRAGQELMARAAAEHGFTVERPISLSLDRERGVYNYVVRGSRDIQDYGGQTRVLFDADSGEQKLLLLPTGQYAGNTVTSWLVGLHTAHVFGLPYRLFVCGFGLALAGLSVTGVVIWLRKRRSARLQRERHAAVA